MIIDFYISSLSSGGAEHVLTNIATDFAKKGQDVSIASFEKRSQFYSVDSKVKIIKYDYTKKNKVIELLYDFRATKKQLKSRKADVAISFLSRCNIMLILAGVFSKTKIIVCDRNNLLRKYPRYVFTISCWIYSLADAVCVQTNVIKSFYPKYLQKKMYVLENPLNFEEMQKQCEGQDLSKENIVISVGRLERQKDFVTLIKAFANIVVDYPEWKLNIWGQGDRKEELELLIEEMQLSGRVSLCGVTRTPFLEMKKSKVFVLSSFFEGFPNVLCEAMHAGLACISTRCECGPAELIDDGVNGYLVPVGDVDQMTASIMKLIEDENLCVQMGKNAKKSIERLELNTICNKWLDMVKGVLYK